MCYGVGMTDKNKIAFGLGNAKLAKSISTFSLPAGHSCPFARECLSKTDHLTGGLLMGYIVVSVVFRLLRKPERPMFGRCAGTILICCGELALKKAWGS